MLRRLLVATPWINLGRDQPSLRYPVLGLREMVERDIDNVEITDTAAVTEANQLAVEDEGHFLLGHTAV